MRTVVMGTATEPSINFAMNYVRWMTAIPWDRTSTTVFGIAIKPGVAITKDAQWKAVRTVVSMSIMGITTARPTMARDTDAEDGEISKLKG